MAFHAWCRLGPPVPTQRPGCMEVAVELRAGGDTDYWITDYKICLEWITGLWPALRVDYRITALT